MGEIIMPKVGDAMTEGKVVRWYKKAGDAVKVGEPVLEIETDKVNLDLEAEEDGILDDVSAAEGSMIPVGQRVAMVLRKGESPAPKRPEPQSEAKAVAAKEDDQGAAKGEEDDKNTAKAKLGTEAEAEQAKGSTEPIALTADSEPQQARSESKEGAHIRSSPLARRMAREMGLDLSSVRGSGPAGRIVAADVQGMSTSESKPVGSPSPEQKKTTLVRPRAIEAKDIPLSAMRRTIARRLSESIGPIPHFFLTIEADVTALLEIRQQLNEIGDVKTSVNDFVVRACALSLLHHPVVNSSFTAESIKQHGEVHIGIAVSIPEGLITPVVRNADTKSVGEIAVDVRSMAERARNRKLKPGEFQGSTFTISNLGMFGVEEFTAIINPPNAAILAVGAASARPVAVDRQVVVRDRMRMTMSCDHRVIDGAAGAEFLRTLQQYIEQPLRLAV